MEGEYHVYLLHIDPPFGHAKHYAGWTPTTVRRRLTKHKNGEGATLTRHAIEAGCELIVARVWHYDTWQEARDKERKIKKAGKSRICPICKKQKKEGTK
jgi:putative endonuclease